jgi:hypothetical protein
LGCLVGSARSQAERFHDILIPSPCNAITLVDFDKSIAIREVIRYVAKLVCVCLELCTQSVAISCNVSSVFLVPSW